MENAPDPDQNSPEVAEYPEADRLNCAVRTTLSHLATLDFFPFPGILDRASSTTPCKNTVDGGCPIRSVSYIGGEGFTTTDTLGENVSMAKCQLTQADAELSANYSELLRYLREKHATTKLDEVGVAPVPAAAQPSRRKRRRKK